MSMTTAAFIGMGAVVLYGLVAFVHRRAARSRQGAWRG